jgi:hypothetical protein
MHVYPSGSPLFCFVLFYFVFNKVSRRSNWSWTLFVVKGDLELLILLPPSLGWQVCTTIPGLCGAGDWACVCVCVCVCVWIQVCTYHQRTTSVGFLLPLWVLDIEFGVSGLYHKSFYHWATSWPYNSDLLRSRTDLLSCTVWVTYQCFPMGLLAWLATQYESHLAYNSHRTGAPWTLLNEWFTIGRRVT